MAQNLVKNFQISTDGRGDLMIQPLCDMYLIQQFFFFFLSKRLVIWAVNVRESLWNLHAQTGWQTTENLLIGVVVA